MQKQICTINSACMMTFLEQNFKNYYVVLYTIPGNLQFYFSEIFSKIALCVYGEYAKRQKRY
jgi:hypothetical protein